MQKGFFYDHFYSLSIWNLHWKACTYYPHPYLGQILKIGLDYLNCDNIDVIISIKYIYVYVQISPNTKKNKL